MATKNTSTPQPARLIGARRVPAEFGIKYTSLRHLAHGGEIPFIRIGRSMYFERSDLDRWIERQKASTAVG
jgi:excisionase family DNA binding protein